MVDILGIIEDGYGNVVSGADNLIDSVTPAQLAIGAAVAGVVVSGAVVGTIAAISGRKAAKRKAKTKKGRARDRKFRSKQKHELAYVRRKRRLGKKITRPRYKTKTSKPKKRKSRRLKFGSPAYRKKYLGKKRSKRSRRSRSRGKLVSFTTKQGKKVKFYSH